MEKQLSGEHLNNLSQADLLIDQGKTHFEHGRFEEAKGCFAKALEKRNAALGEDAPDCAEARHYLGLSLAETNAFEEAEREFVRSVEIYEKAFYEGHFKLAPVLMDHAAFLMKAGQWEKAEPLCLRAQDIFSKTLHGEHRLIIESTYRLGIIYRKLAKYADAIKLFVKVKKAFESPYGPTEEFKYLEALINQDQGKAKEAETAYLEAIKGFEHRRNLPRLADCLRSYAELLKSQKLSERADEIIAKAEAIEERAEGLSFSGALFTSTLLKA